MSRIIFYNNWHSGDIMISKEFCRNYIKNNPDNDYYYAHNNSPRLLLDIPELKYMNLLPEMVEDKKIIQGNDYTAYNTWIGRTWGYLLPGTGVTLEGLYRRFKDIGFKLSENIYDYIPQIDPFYYKSDYDGTKLEQFNKRIMICNGGVWSSQAINFDFIPIVKELTDTYKNHLFILTERINNFTPNNVVYTDDLFGMPMNDLNEIGYLSTFCELIVGRSSGPFTFAQHLINWNNPNKTLLSFTTHKENSSIIYSDNLPMRKVWCSEIRSDIVYKKISDEIERLE
jgi:hypothetical protein